MMNVLQVIRIVHYDLLLPSVNSVPVSVARVTLFVALLDRQVNLWKYIL